MSYIGNPIVSTDFPVDYFSGNGSTTAFTLSIAPASVNAIDVEVSGVSQSPQTYTISGTTLTFTTALPSGSSNIVVKHRGIAGIPNTPSAASVTTTSIAANAVTPAKLANSGAELGYRNRIINGAMVINQRGFSGSVDNTNPYTLDRWLAYSVNSSKYTVSQNAGSITPPAGFTNYLGVTSSAATSSGSTDYYGIAQKIEGFNTADLNWGTVNAKTVTLSFWVRSSLTGQFGGAIVNSAGDYSYPIAYTISAANTWEQKSITIVGPSAGTWIGATNGVGMSIVFSLGYGSTYTGTAGSWSANAYYNSTGSTSVVGTSGATFYITGVQLEAGTTATNFDYRSYGTELSLCQRYCQKIISDSTSLYCRFGNGFVTSANIANMQIALKTSMRTAPSVTTTGTASNYGIFGAGGTGYICNAVPTVNTYGTSTEILSMQPTTASTMTNGQGCELDANNASGVYLIITAEL